MTAAGDTLKGLMAVPGRLKNATMRYFPRKRRHLSLCPPPPGIFVIEPITICDLRCGMCRLGAGQIERQGKMLEWKDFVVIADKIRPYAKLAYLFQWGEALLHPRIFEMIEYVKRFSKICISTNGNALTQEKAARLIASRADSIIFDLDGMNKETYESFRSGGNFDKALGGLFSLVDARDKAGARNDIILQFIVTRKNEGQIREAEALAGKLGIRLVLKSAYFFDAAMAKMFLPSDPRWRRYDIVDDRLVLKLDRWSCREAWRTFYILVNGDVNPCCHDYNATLRMGNLLKQSFLEIWHGDKYIAFRKAFDERKALPSICQKYCNEPANEG